jgi:hypothetical protein
MRIWDSAGFARAFPTGATLVIDVTGRVRFVISSPPLGSCQQEMEQMAQTQITNALGWKIDDPVADPFAVDYRGMHEART